MNDEHGFAHTSIGYVPITARRGGIKYPTPTKQKEAPMDNTVNRRLAALKQKQQDMALEIAALEAKVKAQRPAPPADQRRWSIVVQFSENGKRYEYLIFRSGGRFYTTGDGSTATFWTWEAFLDWLDENAYRHSAMYQLDIDYKSPVALKGSDD